MDLTVESFRAAAMASIQNNDGSITGNKDATISVKTSKGQTWLVSAKPTSRTKAAANQTVRQQFCDALKKDARFANKQLRDTIDRLVMGAGEERDISTKPLRAREIVSVLKNLTEESGFEGLLADDGINWRENPDKTRILPNGFVHVDAVKMSKEDVNRLKTLLPTEEQQAYLKKYTEAMYSGAAPDFRRLSLLSDYLWVRLAQVNDRVKAGTDLFKALTTTNKELGDVQGKANSEREAAVQPIVKMVKPYTYLSTKGGYSDPNSSIAKILRACIESFCKANGDLIARGYSVKNADELMSKLMDTLSTAERYVISYEKVAAEIDHLVDSCAEKHGLDAKRTATLKDYAEGRLSSTLSDVNNANGKENAIRDIFHRDGKSFYEIFSDDLLAEAAKLTKKTDVEFIQDAVKNVMDKFNTEDFDKTLAETVKHSFGDDSIKLGFGEKGQQTSSVSLLISKKVEEEIRLQFDKGKVVRGDALEKSALDVAITYKQTALNAVRTAGEYVMNAKNSQANLAWQKIGGIIFDSKLFKYKGADVLEEPFKKSFFSSQTFQNIVSVQVSQLLDNPFDGDVCVGFKEAVRVVADETVKRVGDNCKAIRDLFEKGSETIKSFLDAEPDGTTYGITAEQQKQIRECLDAARCIELGKCVSNPEKYDAQLGCALQIGNIDKKINELQMACANAFRAATQPAVPEEKPVASEAPAEVRQKPVRSFTPAETRRLNEKILEITDSFKWPKEDLPLREEFGDMCAVLTNAVKGYLRGLVKAGGDNAEDLENRMETLAKELWKAGLESIVTFTRLMDSALAKRGANRLVNLTGIWNDYAPRKTTKTGSSNPLVSKILDVTLGAIQQILSPKLYNGKPLTADEWKTLKKNVEGIADKYFVPLIRSEANRRTQTAQTGADAILTDLCREIACVKTSKLGKALQSVLNDFTRIRLADENKYWEPDDIVEGCHDLVNRFREFRNRIIAELDSRMVGDLADLSGSQRIEYVDGEINSCLEFVRVAPDDGKLAAFDKVLQTPVADIVDNIMSGVRDRFDTWRGGSAQNTVAHSKVFLAEKFGRDWITGSFINDLKLMNASKPFSLSNFDSLAQMFSGLSTSIQGLIANKIRDDVKNVINPIAEKVEKAEKEKKGQKEIAALCGTNQELSKTIHGIEMANLQLVQNANRVTAACRDALKKIQKSKGMSVVDDSIREQIDSEIDSEIERMLSDPAVYAKQHFGVISDDTSADFVGRVTDLLG